MICNQDARNEDGRRRPLVGEDARTNENEETSVDEADPKHPGSVGRLDFETTDFHRGPIRLDYAGELF